MYTVTLNIEGQKLDVSGEYYPGTKDILYPDQSGVPGTSSRFEVEKVIWLKSETPLHNVEVTDLALSLIMDIEDRCLEIIENNIDNTL